MIELQTSVKQDDTTRTRTRTPKPGYLNLSNIKFIYQFFCEFYFCDRVGLLERIEPLFPHYWHLRRDYFGGFIVCYTLRVDINNVAKEAIDGARREVEGFAFSSEPQ